MSGLRPDAAGVAFYGSATFDTDVRPGVITHDNNDQEASDWEGHVLAGEFAVYASASDRRTVADILASAD